jgi:putative drug exporter of the RND superfamily
MTEKLARACALHPWRTVAAWAGGIVLAAVAVALLLGSGLSTEAQVTNNPESERAVALRDARFPAREVVDEVVVVRSETATVRDEAFRAEVQGLHDAFSKAGAATRSFITGEQTLVSDDGRAAALLVRVGLDSAAAIERIVEAVTAADAKEGFAVTVTGAYTLDRDVNRLSQSDLKEGELKFGLPAAMIILALVFGALVAASLPILLAIVSIVVALGLTALVATGFQLSVFVVNMLVAMGLALGIDYALFTVSRFREERAAGREKLDAIATTGATANRAVLFSGSAFVIAMLGLLLVQSTIMRSLAAGAILVGVVSVVAALTLLPALLSLLGDKVNRLRAPSLQRLARREASAESRVWDRVVRVVVRRPGLSLALATVLLLAFAAPALTMNIGAAGTSTLPDHLLAKQGALAVERYFPQAATDPAQVVIDGRMSDPAVEAAVAALQSRLAGDRDFGPATLAVSPRGDLGVLTVPLVGDPLAERAVDAVRRLRAEHVPAAFGDTGVPALVAGTTALNVDYFDVMAFWLPLVVAVVLALSFCLLTIAFRSVVVPLTAVAMNLLSVGAAYGLLVLVFQHGVGAELLGFRQVETIEAWIPLFLFAVLFGLSMDYQVFLLSRIRERYSQTRDTKDAVTFGVSSTARIITGAALIIVAVFAGFARGDLVMFQQMGFGVAVALLLDATVVRGVVVPASMALLGERNWYLPRWLEWLPHVEVEGAHDDEGARDEAMPEAPPAVQPG